MSASRTKISKAKSYKEIGEFWDTHDAADYWDQFREVKFHVDIQSQTTYYPIEASLSSALRSFAKRRGVAPDVLLNLWVQEKVREAER